MDGVTVWFVHDVANTTVHEDFLNWITGGNRGAFWSKEMTYLPDLLKGKRDDYVRTVAWWEVDSDVMFALDSDTAGRLAAGIRG